MPGIPSFPKTVLMTTDTVGGVWTYAVELCKALGATRTKVVLATMGPAPGPDQRAELAGLRNVALEESTFRLEWMDDPWTDVERAGNWLLDLERKHLPDLVHLNGYVHAALPWNAPVLVVAHSCVLSWWRAVKGTAPPPSWNQYRRAVAAGLNAADKVIAPSDSMALTLVRNYDFRNCQTIYNGRDPGDFASTGPKAPMILTAGRLWDEAKNVAALAAVAPDLQWPVSVVGQTLHDLPNLRCLGRCSRLDVSAHMGAAAIYALPARYEPFGLSALEAAFSGCALVLGYIDSLREIWGDAALFVDPGNEAQLAAALRHLIEHPEKRLKMARRAVQRANCYTLDRMIRNYLDAYRELVPAAPTGSARLARTS